MIARLLFVAVAGFWVTMNVLFWRSEFGESGTETPVPVSFVWKKILTTPDTASLNVYQKNQRIGFCEFSTGIARQMSALDQDKVPPEGLSGPPGYRVHFSGNVSWGQLTHRLKFSGEFLFSPQRDWQEIELKLNARPTSVDITSIATNQTVEVRIANGGEVVEHHFTFAELRNPGQLMHTLLGNFADFFLGGLDLGELIPRDTAQKIQWTACRTRIKVGGENVPAYRLQTSLLGNTVTLHVSTLGDILRVELPGNITARIDEWTRP